MEHVLYKFRRHTIGQSHSAVCTNKGGQRERDAFSNKWCGVPYVLRGLLSRPLSLEQSERQGLFFVVPIDSLVVDSTFEQSKNVTIAVVSSSSCC